jgi:thiol-disulfide isomerase/thioredoxin
MASAVLSATLPRPSPDFAIHLTPSGETSPTQYKGKVVVLAFIQTTCPHCQHSTQILSGLQKEYGARGLQVLEAAFNDLSETLVPGFVQKFQPTFPVGWTTHREVLAYLNHTVMTPIYVPTIVFIDRSGMIRRQYIGGDPFLDNQEKNLRDTLEELLKQPIVSKR